MCVATYIWEETQSKNGKTFTTGKFRWEVYGCTLTILTRFCFIWNPSLKRGGEGEQQLAKLGLQRWVTGNRNAKGPSKQSPSCGSQKPPSAGVGLLWVKGLPRRCVPSVKWFKALPRPHLERFIMFLYTCRLNRSTLQNMDNFSLVT